MRQTAQRAAILSFLRAERRHYSAAEIYDAVRETLPSISLGTVYRNLGQLLESGEILSVEAVDKRVYYDGYTAAHAHFVCDSCHGIYDFPIEDSETLAPTREGFQIKDERVIYYGTCADCLKNQKK